MHKTIYILPLLAVCLWPVDSLLAAPPDGRPARLTAGEQAGPVKGAQGPKRPTLANRFGGGDPTLMATRLLQQFDRDGDEKLDRGELMALFAFMRERAGDPSGTEKPRPALRGDRQDREVGGDKPQRPNSK